MSGVRGPRSGVRGCHPEGANADEGSLPDYVGVGMTLVTHSSL